MFEYFSKAAGTAVEIVGYEPPEVLFRCKQPLTLGITDIRANVAGVEMKARVRIVEVESEAARGVWLAPQEAVPYLAQLFAPPDKRRSPRFPRTLRVSSEQGFHGWSIDISHEGLRFETEGGLDLGQSVRISLDLDDAFQTRLEVDADVRWCAPALTEGWIVAGLEFQTLSASCPDCQRYERFLERLAQTETPAL